MNLLMYMIYKLYNLVLGHLAFILALELEKYQQTNFQI